MTIRETSGLVTIHVLAYTLNYVDLLAICRLLDFKNRKLNAFRAAQKS